MSARPWQTQQLWDWSSCCSGDITKNFFFGLISTLFGYTVSIAGHEIFTRQLVSESMPCPA